MVETLDAPDSLFFPFGKDQKSKIRMMSSIDSSGKAVLGSIDGEVLVWDFRKNSLVSRIAPKRQTITDFVPNNAHFMSDGKFLVLCWDSYVAVYDTFTGKQVKVFHQGFWKRGIEHHMRGAEFINNEDEFVTGHLSGAINAWHWSKKKPVRTLKPHNDAIRTICRAGEDVLIAGTQNGVFQRTVLSTGETAFLDFQSRIDKIVYAEEMNSAVVLCAPNVIEVFDIDEPDRTQIEVTGAEIVSLAFSERHNAIAAGGKDGTILVIDPINTNILLKLQGEENEEVWGLSFEDEAGLLVSAGNGVKFWDIQMPMRSAERYRF